MIYAIFDYIYYYYHFYFGLLAYYPPFYNIDFGLFYYADILLESVNIFVGI